MLRRIAASLIAATLLASLSSTAHAETESPQAAAPAVAKETVYLTMASSLSAVAVAPGEYIVLAPMSIELGFVPQRRVELGVSFDYAKSTSLGCSECGAQRWRGVARARAHLFDGQPLLDPWVGGGIGYQRLSVPAMNATGQDPFGGVDFIAEIGLDIKLTQGLKLGPRVAAELSFRDSNAPAWAVGMTTIPYQIEAGLRLGYAF